MEIIKHNHITRDIKQEGVCPACDVYHSNHNKQKHALKYKTLDKILKEAVLQRYKELDENKTLTAETLGISRATMYRYLDEMGV